MRVNTSQKRSSDGFVSSKYRWIHQCHRKYPTHAKRIFFEATFGAGTLTQSSEINALAETGAQLAISPHCKPELIRQALSLNLKPMPGVLTPSEAYAAIDAGATDLKFFPALLLGPAGFKAIKAILPPTIGCWAVGGINSNTFKEWLTMGIDGFGVGSALYKPGWTPKQVENAAKLLVAQLQEIG